jgi:hypothetical protein
MALLSPFASDRLHLLFGLSPLLVLRGRPLRPLTSAALRAWPYSHAFVAVSARQMSVDVLW